MTIPILTTKLYLPTPRADHIHRQRLIDQLNIGISRKFTLISAPAGFGKSTLLSTWVHQIGESGRRKDYLHTSKIAWLSLEENDNDLTRFLTYFVAALQTIESHIGQSTLAALQSSGLVDTEIILTILLNEIAEFSGNVVLILDDYHIIESQPIDRAITFFLDHMPKLMHLVIASRIDPTLPLSRLRARGQMAEIRADDLRFTQNEAIAFLNQVMGLDLKIDDVVALGKRTEGWIAGLQLAALSMQGYESDDDISDFLNRFTGSDRYIHDYLTDEVLQQRPEGTRDFLLQTSILNRLSAPLCDAVRSDGSTKDSQVILESLEDANLFIVALDNERRWYRYHHLFADLLRQRLGQTHRQQIPILHRRASEWYEAQLLPSDAIHHALAADDFERAADLAELAWPAMSGSFQSIEWLGWLKALPDELVRARPVLSVGYAWALLNAGKLEAAEARLVDAERLLEPTFDMSDRTEALSTKMVVVDEEQFRTLPASLATARAYHAQAIGDLSGTVKYARQVLDLLPEGDLKWRGDATALLGLAYWADGDLEAAHQTLSVGLAGMDPLDVIVGTFVLADMKATLGQLHAAVRTCEHALQLATDHGDPMPLGTEDVYTGISALHRERGDLEAAAQDLAAAKKLGDRVELPDWQYRWCIAQARLKETMGDMDGALNLLDKAERLFVRTPLPKVRPIAALKTRIWVAQGRLVEALNWVRERDLSPDDDLSYLREFEHLILARVLIAQFKSDRDEGSLQGAVRLLKRLLQAAEEGGRMGSVIKILVLQALAHEAQGKIPSSLVSLERAMTLAKPEGYFRIFVDEGSLMEQLLHEAAKREIYPDYTKQLLAAFASERAGVSTRQPQNLVEQLTARELEVLRLVAQGLTNREISERLYLALDTVKGHNRNIYGKLGVKKRIQAVEKARESGLL